ncbi:hypothetical protein WA026_014617 [Henosepilachna vigintioctopunctata]|uniref:Uncharacterized protein n=1 Tax=Henosepilachna vigintioctopunctata TaxID=420089 RepID=A0AAW1VCX5_9CUCU
MEEREKPDGHSPDTSGQKWPLKPGLLVPGHKLQNINVIQLGQEAVPFKSTRKLNQSKYKKNNPKVYVGLERIKTFLGFNGYDYVPSGLTERSTGVVTFKKIARTSDTQEIPKVVSRKRKKPGSVPNQSSLGDKARLGAAPPAGGLADPMYDPDKGFYENLPFHSMQTPPNKPISVIAPFNQAHNQNITSSTKSLLPDQSNRTCSSQSIQTISVKRNQSFSGFPRPLNPGMLANDFLNHSDMQPFNNNFYPHFNPWNSLYKPYHSQNFLNRPPIPSIFYNLPPNFQFMNGNSTVSGISTQHNMVNALRHPFNMQLLNVMQNPFSQLPSQRNNSRRNISSERVFKSSKSDISSSSREISEITSEKLDSKQSAEKMKKPNVSRLELGSQSDSEAHKNNMKNTSLVLKKHKCYSPTFHSLRCQKHGTKRTLVYAIPKRVLSDGDLPNIKDTADSDTPNFKRYRIIPIPAPRCKKHRKPDTIYQNVAENVQNESVLDTSNESTVDIISGEISITQAEIHATPRVDGVNNNQSTSTKDVTTNFSLKKPPRKKNNMNTAIGTSLVAQTASNGKSVVDTKPKLVAVSPKRPVDIPLTSSVFKSCPTVKICPNLKSPNEIQKGVLSMQIKAKIKGSPNQIPSPSPSIRSTKSDSENISVPLLGKKKIEADTISESKEDVERITAPPLARIKCSPNKISSSPKNDSQTTGSSMSDTEIPRMPLLDTSDSKWSPKFKQNNEQNAFYTLTSPHMKPSSADLAPQYSATIPHPKHTKLIPRALFQEQQLPKSKSFSNKSKQKKHFQIPLQKCHSFKFQTAESYFQPIKNLHEENLMKNGYVSDYQDANCVAKSSNKREKHKQKTNGPLVVLRPKDYQESLSFQENVQSSVHLQYPQPGLNSPLKPQSGRPNGLVYADLDMPKSNRRGGGGGTSKSKQQKHKPKTEYATLQFNDIGQEIDV